MKTKQQKLREQRNAERKEALKNNPDFIRLQKLLSINYLIHNHSLVVYDEIEEILKRNDLNTAKMISMGNKLNRAYDNYFRNTHKWIGSNGQNALLTDLNRLGELLDRFMNGEGIVMTSDVVPKNTRKPQMTKAQEETSATLIANGWVILDDEDQDYVTLKSSETRARWFVRFEADMMHAYTWRVGKRRSFYEKKFDDEQLSLMLNNT